MIIESKDAQAIAKKLAQIIAIYPQLTNVSLKLPVNSDSINFEFSNAEISITYKYAVPVSESTAFDVTVAAKTFVDYLSALSAADITLIYTDDYLRISSGKSKYKIALIATTACICSPMLDTNRALTKFSLTSAMVASLIQVNAKEFNRNKNSKNPVNQIYYLSSIGCFNAANNFGACLNLFSNDLNTELLLSQSLVRLLGTSEQDWTCEAQQNKVHSVVQNILHLTNNDFDILTYQPADPRVRSTLVTMFAKMKQLTTSFHSCVLGLNVADLTQALARLTLAAKHESLSADMQKILKFTAVDNQLTIIDAAGNTELLVLEPGAQLTDSCTFGVILKDLQTVVTSCKDETIKLSLNTGAPIVCEFGQVRYILANISE